MNQELKDLIIKEYGYEVLDMLSVLPYKHISDYLKSRMEELQIDFQFCEVKDLTAWASDIDSYKRRSYIYHSYMANIIKYEYSDSLK